MKNDNGSSRHAVSRSQITRRIFLQYIVSLAAYATVVVLTLVIGWWVCTSITWYGDEMLYRLLQWVLDYIVLVIGFVLLSGWLIISLFFIRRPLRYLDGIIDASEHLATPDEVPISLPDPMKNVQDELNLIRERALRDARAARDAEQRKNDLIVYLAHDLKTPLTSVIGYLTLLKDEPDISAQTRSRYTGIALDKAMRLEELINEFFEITRFNLSQLQLNRESVDISLMLRQLISEFEPMLQERSLTCQLHGPDKLIYACDPDKLARVFDNLLRNAVYYSFENSQIDITFSQGSDGLSISFQNRGHTIPPEKLTRIFDQFFRLDDSRGTRTGGAGLGLAIAKEIVELHGGVIKAESSNDTIIFSIHLP